MKLTDEQYEDLKGLLYDNVDNPFTNSHIAEVILKLIEENTEEYWVQEAYQRSYDGYDHI